MKMCMCDFDGARTNFDRITAFEFVILGIFCMAGYEVCVINSSYSFQWMFQGLRSHIVDILIMRMWAFDGARINLDRITAFQTKPFWAVFFFFFFCTIEYGVCVISSIYSFQWNHF